jgi:methylase of polypeptide subunit release factors
LKAMRCWEPCSNRGYMARPLKEYFARVHTSDVCDYSLDPATVECQDRVVDFLFPFSESTCIEHQGVDWIITNPPFRLAEQIIQRGRDIARQGVAVLVRSAFLEGVDRYNTLFSISPPTLVAQFSERVIMHKGVLRDPSKEYLDERTGTMKRPSTATSYTWLVWCIGMARKPLIWIPPCRRQLERAGDYPNG